MTASNDLRKPLDLIFRRIASIALLVAFPIVLHLASRSPLLTTSTAATMPKKLTFTPTTNTNSFFPSSISGSSTAASRSIPSTFTDSLPLPSLIVFDLDYTLWPFWVDTHVSGPLKPKDNNTRMVDRWGESFTFYRDVPSILSAARERGISMSLASRTHAPELAREMLKGLMVPTSLSKDASVAEDGSEGGKKAKNEKPLRALEFFTHMQIFPGSKTTHFVKIQEATKKAGSEIAFADMLFFDDEARNRNVEAELGVTFWLVRDGVSKEEIDNGVWEWRKRRGIKRWARTEPAELEA